MPKRNGTGIELLADPTRRLIIATIATRSVSSGLIARAIERSPSATSRQLGLLYDAGLVDANRSILDGRVVMYRINSTWRGRIIAWLAATEVGLAKTETVLHRNPPAWGGGHRHRGPRCRDWT